MCRTKDLFFILIVLVAGAAISLFPKLFLIELKFYGVGRIFDYSHDKYL